MIGTVRVKVIGTVDAEGRRGGAVKYGQRGEVAQPGDVIDLPGESVDQLVALGAVEIVKETPDA